MKLVYLAGPITGGDWELATKWRREAGVFLAQHGIQALDPLRGKDFLKKIIERTTGTFDKQYTCHPLSTAHGILKRDRWDVYRSDLVLVNFTELPEIKAGRTKIDQISIGTVMEIAWADAWDKYILVAMEKDNAHWHGMLTEAASLIVPTLEEALELVPVILGEGNA